MTQRKKRKIFGRNEIIFLAVVGALIIFFAVPKTLNSIDCKRIGENHPMLHKLGDLGNKFAFGIMTYGTTPERFKDYDPIMAQQLYASHKSQEISPQQALDIADQMDIEISRLKSLEIRNTKLRQSWFKVLQAHTVHAQKVRAWAANPIRHIRYSSDKWVDNDLSTDGWFEISQICQ